MPTNFAYMQQGLMQEIAADQVENLTTGPDSDPIFRILPLTTTQNQFLEWEQEDIEGGLMNVRALDGKFPVISRVGAKAWLMKPGYYGEQYPITEEDLTNSRRFGTFGDPKSEAEFIGKATKYLTNRAIRRMKNVGWSTLTTGTFSVTDELGTAQHSDTFNIRSVALSDWSVLATSTPVLDLQNLFTYGRGFGASFGMGAEVLMNQKTFNNLVQNQNANDFGGIRDASGATVKFAGPTMVNSMLQSYGCPSITVYDGTYRTSNGENASVSLWIPDDTLVVIGARQDGNTIGEIRQTWNATGRGPGLYVGASNDPDPPFLPRPYSAVNFGPVIYYPNSILRCTC